MPIGLLEGAAIAIMLWWLALSAVCQIPCDLTRKLRALDLAGLVPHWTFFAPVPGTCDYYLLYRDELDDGSLTDWRELSLCDSRQPWHLVWNPRKREKKALFDLAVALVREIKPDLLEAIQLSVPYLALLTYVSSVPRTYQARATQFLLMISDEISVGVDPEPVFTSAIHPL